jgi:two-component system, NarL family, sensor histidine kinase DesK
MNSYANTNIPRWVPYIWLAYLIFFFWGPVSNHAGWLEWIAIAAGVACFLFFYFSFFGSRWPWSVVHTLGILAIGVVFAPFNGGANSFFIYAASMIPFAVDSELGGALGIAGIVGLAFLENWIFHIPAGFLFPATFLSTFIGAANIYFAQRNRHVLELRRANAEIEELAKVAERERIARDLHDVLGHTLTLITLKSELAGKLIDRDPAQARLEIRDVEHTARQALTDVRQAIGGYRSKGLAAEIKQAAATLEIAGVKAEVRSAPLELPATQESVLTLVLREAVTNVVRHACATHCRVQVERVNGHCRLEVSDNGRGGPAVEGNGLRGMRERVEMLGGSIERDVSRGTRLTVRLPIEPYEEAAQA